MKYFKYIYAADLIAHEDMNNFKLTIQYDGTDYAGWQVQNNAVSVQQKIIDAIAILLKEKVNLIGAGRTDTGVHALGQTANFRTEKEIEEFKFRYQLNSLLPRDISITEIKKVTPEFHARFDAKKRSYIYLISKHKSPFYDRYSYRYKGKLDITEMNKVSRIFLGSHDFTSFCRKNSDTKNKICNIYDIHWRETDGMIYFFIEADRFLHGMVRTIIGTLLEVVQNNLSDDHINGLFEAKERDLAGTAVPGKGLFLYKVKY